MTAYKNPSPCVSILIVDKDERVLLGRRYDKTKIKPNQWSLPCGYIELRENYIDAAVREVKEETNLDIEIKSIVNVVSNHFDDEVHSLVIVLLAEPRPDSAEAKAGDDLSELMWTSIDGELPPIAFQGDIHIISQYKRYKKEFGIPLDITTYEFFETAK